MNHFDNEIYNFTLSAMFVKASDSVSGILFPENKQFIMYF